MDYALGEKISIEVKVRWARFDEMSGSVRWDLIRSHALVRADGETPFTGQLNLDGIEYRGVTLGLKHCFWAACTAAPVASGATPTGTAAITICPIARSLDTG